jgi:hypothetical protein
LLHSEKLLNDVYNYWAAKRKRWGKPILRRLQAPTLASDTNPYNTFRCAATRASAALQWACSHLSCMQETLTESSAPATSPMHKQDA